MIQVLQNWQEVENATDWLKQRGLPTHLTVQKNWDQYWLAQQLQAQGAFDRVLDLGCGDCCTLDFLAALGISELHGVDLEIKPFEGDRPYTLHQGDLTATLFPDQFCDGLVSISVIEHGVDLQRFFAEAHRLLKPGGLLFVTTDYWQEPIAIDPAIRPFGLTWKIFSQEEIEAAIAIAQQQGFELVNGSEIPACSEKPVSWYNRDYTFIALAFQK